MGYSTSYQLAVASNNAEITRGRPFQAGNTHGKGRPAGSRNKATIALQSLLEGEGEAITRKAVEMMALEGDTTALRLCLDRLLPPVRDKLINLSLPKAETARDVTKAVGVVLEALGQGDITPSEAQTVVSLLETHRKAIETADLEARIAELESSRQ